MNGPRFLPSGNRLGPYFCRRLRLGGVEPLVALVESRFSTSPWTGHARQHCRWRLLPLLLHPFA